MKRTIALLGVLFATTACSKGFQTGLSVDEVELASTLDLGDKLRMGNADLHVVSAAQTVALGKCSKVVQVALRTSTGEANTFSGNVGVPLSSSSSGVTFYSNSTCTTAVSKFTLAGSTGTGRFFFKSSVAGSITVTANLLNILEASQAETILGATQPVPVPVPVPQPQPTTGFPNASNTGPVAGTVFQNFSDVYYVKTDGAVINGLRGKGAIVVQARNVTIQNCEIDASGQIWGIFAEEGMGLKVKNCRVYAVANNANPEAGHNLVAIAGADEVAFNDIYGVHNAITCGSCHIHDNYIHDFQRFISRDEHTDGLQTWGYAGAGGLRVIHNTILAVTTSGDYTPTNYGAGSSVLALIDGMHDLVVDDNLFAGGTYTLYGPSERGSSPANVRITNNRFSTRYYQKCGMFGTHAGFNSSAPGFQWGGNVWHESGLPLNH